MYVGQCVTAPTYAPTHRPTTLTYASPYVNTTTLAGNGTEATINGPLSHATFDQPIALCYDSSRDFLYVIDHSSSIDGGYPATLRRVDLNSGFRNVSTLVSQYIWEDPTSCAVDVSGNVYVGQRQFVSSLAIATHHLTVTNVVSGRFNGS